METQLGSECRARPGDDRKQRLSDRLLSLKVGAMLVRNTVVSTSAFFVGLTVLWVLVNRFGVSPVTAAAIGFVLSNTLHYALGRAWIFRGTQRGIRSGYALFLINAAIGLMLTVLLYAGMLRFTSIDYLSARILVSLFAGLVMFLLNATLNFRQV